MAALLSQSQSLRQITLQSTSDANLVWVSFLEEMADIQLAVIAVVHSTVTIFRGRMEEAQRSSPSQGALAVIFKAVAVAAILAQVDSQIRMFPVVQEVVYREVVVQGLEQTVEVVERNSLEVQAASGHLEPRLVTLAQIRAEVKEDPTTSAEAEAEAVALEAEADRGALGLMIQTFTLTTAVVEEEAQAALPYLRATSPPTQLVSTQGMALRNSVSFRARLLLLLVLRHAHRAPLSVGHSVVHSTASA